MPSLSLQQKFNALLQGTSALFSSHEQQGNQDRDALQRLRDLVLDFAKEAARPDFDRFLAYLLGVTAFDAQYPLQILRLLSLTARSAVIGNAPAPVFNDLVTAAFFADVGFRPIWLGQKGTHSELAAYHLRNMNFPWFTPSIQSLIENHHDIAGDMSPGKCLSLWARYLEIVYAMGSDNPPSSLLLPSVALEALIENDLGSIVGIKLLLKTVSAFPLGSWVQLSSGNPGIVIGANPNNPLRPRVGLYRKKSGRWEWEEHALQNEPATQVIREIRPTPAQETFSNFPKVWFPEWQETTDHGVGDLGIVFTLSTDEQVNAAPTPAEGSSAAQRIWTDQGPVASKPSVSGAGSSPTGPSNGSAETSDAELKKLRADWESHVRLMEESILKLRGGLVESYRRENNHFRELLGALAKPVTPAVETKDSGGPTIRATRSHSDALDLAIREVSALETKIADQEALLKNEDETLRARIREAFDHVEQIKRRLPTTPPAGFAPTLEKITRWQDELRMISKNLLPPVVVAGPALTALKAKTAAARTFLMGLADKLETLSPNELTQSIREWSQRFSVPLLEARSTSDEEWAVQKTRLEKISRLLAEHIDGAEALQKTLGPL